MATVAAASGDAPLWMLLSGTDPAAALDAATKDHRLSRSFLRGCVVLSALPRDGAPIGVVELSDRIGASTGTTHRYLVTLLELGLIERDGKTRQYSLATEVVPEPAIAAPATNGSS